MSWFCEEPVVFRSAFADAELCSLGAKRDQIASDGQEHFLDDGEDSPGFIFGSGSGIGKVAKGVQRAFEGNAFQINIVGKSGLLHEAANEVVGDEVHAQFAFDHVRGFAAQDVHVEVDFDLAKMEFDAPAAEIKVGEVGGGNGGIEKGGHQGDALGAKTRVCKVFADGGYVGELLILTAALIPGRGLTLEIIKRNVPGFKVLPKRWVVERTFAWLGRYRRLAKDYKRKTRHSQAAIYVASCKIMLGKPGK